MEVLEIFREAALEELIWSPTRKNSIIDSIDVLLKFCKYYGVNILVGVL